LQHVRTMLLQGKSEEDQAAILDLYRQVRRTKRVKDDDTNRIINLLRLSGLVKVRENDLWVRNHIYFRVFDEAWIRANLPDAEQQRQRAAYRRGVMITGTVASAIIAALGGGAYWYLKSYVWEDVTYCNTYAKRFGIMECVGQLTPEQVKGRAQSFKFIRRGTAHPVHKLQIVNSDGECNPRHGMGTYLKQADWQDTRKPLRECQWEFVVDAEGNIVYEKAFNQENRLVWGLVYSPPLDGEKKPTRAHFVGADGFPKPQTPSSAKFVKFQYSVNGDEIVRYYVDDNDQPQPAIDKAFGKRLKFDDRGLKIEEVSLDASGQPMNDEAGNAGVKLAYDELGNVVEQVAFDAMGQPILLKDGYHKTTAQYDARGNQTEVAYFGTDGQPILHKDGYHKWTVQYDAQGNQTEIAYFGTDGQPILHKDGYHKWTVQFDAQGNQIENAFFGTDGQPILHKDGYHKSTSQFDARGNEIERAFFGTDGQPILHKDGLHKWIAQFDARGNEIERAFFGTDEQPILHRDGYHKWVRLYDERGNEIENSFFGTDGQPILRSEGIHKWITQYDIQGNLIEEVYFGTDGQQVVHKGCYCHKIKLEYDEQGRETNRFFFDVSGQQVDGKPPTSTFNFSDIFAAMQPKQVVVVSTLPKSQGEQLGIQPGDIFVEYDHVAIINTKLFITKRDFEPKDGAPKELKVSRNGKELSFQIKPGKIGVELKDEPL